MRMRNKMANDKSYRPERNRGVAKPTGSEKKAQANNVGHGMRTHEERFEKERVASVNAKKLNHYIEKVKESERRAARPK